MTIPSHSEILKYIVPSLQVRIPDVCLHLGSGAGPVVSRSVTSYFRCCISKISAGYTVRTSFKVCMHVKHN